MNQLIYGIKDFVADEDGVTMIEYGLLASLIAIVAILAITQTGTAVKSVFMTVCTKLGGTACGG